MENLRHWIQQEGRVRARWSLLFFGLLLLTLAWPVSESVHAQVKTPILWLWSFAAIFQFGRLLQTWAARSLLLGHAPGATAASHSDTGLQPSPPVNQTPPWAPGYSDPSLPHFRSAIHRYAGPEIRAFASLEEAALNGWAFTDAVAYFGDKPVPATATLNGIVYDYSGLMAAGSQVPAEMRVFGNLAYRRRPPGTETVISPNAPPIGA